MFFNVNGFIGTLHYGHKRKVKLSSRKSVADPAGHRQRAPHVNPSLKGSIPGSFSVYLMLSIFQYANM